MIDYLLLLNVLTWLAIALLVTAGTAAAYYWVLALMSLFPQGKRDHSKDDSPSLRFAFVIPAHNEEAGLGQTLEQLKQLDYPAEACDVFVIADNCTDRTAEVARHQGVHCLERFDTQNRGKDHALEWAFGKLLDKSYDAYIILDADCQLDAHALTTFSRRLQQGDRVLQCNYLASNPDENALSYCLAVANYLENYVFYAPKSRLGWTVFLRGTGMVFHREILERTPWKAGSIVEDLDYSLKLTQLHIPVRFLSDVTVLSAFPVQHDEFSVQRKRWIHGGLPLAISRGLALMGQGLRCFDARLLEAGWSLILKTRSAVFFLTILATTFAIAVGGLRHDATGRWLMGAGLAVLMSYVCYFALGMAWVGLSWKRLRFALSAPFTLISFLAISATSMLKINSTPTGWIRTPRADELALTAKCDIAAPKEDS